MSIFSSVDNWPVSRSKLVLGWLETVCKIICKIGIYKTTLYLNYFLRFHEAIYVFSDKYDDLRRAYNRCFWRTDVKVHMVNIMKWTKRTPAGYYNWEKWLKSRKVGAVILVLDSFMHPPHLRFSCDRIEKEHSSVQKTTWMNCHILLIEIFIK